MTGRTVILSDDAAADLNELHAYIAHHDTPDKADAVFSRIERAILSLAESPERGAVPAELSAVGSRTYREVFFKPYRIVYRVLPDAVLVLLIADDRRDMQTLLQRRLLGT